MDRDARFLLDMYLAAARIRARTDGRSVHDLEADPLLLDSVYWQMCVLGEAANQLSDDFREDHTDTPWHAVVGIRNRLIHGYRDIENDVVWDVIQTHLPPLMAFLSQYVSLDDPDAE